MRLAFSTIVLFLVTLSSANAQVVRNYTLQTIDNEKVNLLDLKGEKVTVLDFWTTFCRPCKKAIPELNKIYEEYKDQGVQVVGVNCDGPRTVAKVPGVSNTLKIQYPVLIDVSSEVFNSLNFSELPTLIIINEKNRIEYIHEGFIPGDEEEIKEAINSALK